MNGEEGVILNGRGRRMRIDLRDPQHVNVLLSLTTLLTLVGTVWFLSAQWYAWKTHQKIDWNMPEQAEWCSQTSEINSPENLSKYGWRPSSVRAIHKDFAIGQN